MKKTKTQKGITLIALIITIVILLILAVVAINSVQDEGIIAHAKNATSEYTKRADEENQLLQNLLNYISENTNEDEEENEGNNDGNNDGNEDGNDDVLHHSGVVPTGGVYTAADGTVYNAGDNFPAAVQDGDIYTFGDYEYRYNYSFNASWTKNSVFSSLGLQISDGWGVRVLETTKSTYGEIINSINNAQIVSMSSTFNGCTLMEKAPKIPESVELMSSTFLNCVLMEKAPVIPSNVTNISSAFCGATALTGEVEINANPSVVAQCFYNTEKDIILTGSASEATKAALAATANKGNVE